MTRTGPETPGVASPDETWAALSERRTALMVDVRTRAEWAFVGAPDAAGAAGNIVFIEWRSFPSMALNEDFLGALDRAVAETGCDTVYFICRSGGRSHDAASAAWAHFSASGRRVACVNVLEGFEGDLDDDGRRGRLNGWKARGLPWRQS